MTPELPSLAGCRVNSDAVSDPWAFSAEEPSIGDHQQVTAGSYSRIRQFAVARRCQVRESSPS